MPRVKRILIGVAALAVAALFTGPKVYRMAQIRGFVPGAQVSAETVVEKWHQTPEQHHDGRDVFWVTWSESDIRARGSHRLNLPEELWNTVTVGGPIEIVRLEGGSEPHHRQGIYASNGNLAFDLILLGVLLFLAVRNIPLSRPRGQPARE